VFAPALIFSSFRKITNLQDSEAVFLSAAFVFAGTYLLSLLVETAFLKERNPAFELSSTVMNSGYLGIPLIYLMFGERALPIAVTYMISMSVLHFSLGILILKKSLKSGIVEAVKIPLIYAVIFSILAKNLQIPSGFEKMIRLTGNATMPLMLVSIGISLSRINLKDLKLGFVSTLVRFFGGTLTSIACVKLLGIPEFNGKVIIVQSSLPSAILNFVLCERFNVHPQTAASSILISTLLFPVYMLSLIELLR